MKRFLSSVLLVLLFSPMAAAHIVLSAKSPTNDPGFNSPPPRDPSDAIKDDAKKGLVCGEVFKNGQFVEPARTTPKSYISGQMITVEWDETIDHFGRFIIDFSADGVQFQAPLATITDVTTAGVSRANPLHHKYSIKLPSITCDLCVLRLRQQMDDQIVGGKPQEYFSCADVKLAASTPPVTPVPSNPNPSPTQTPPPSPQGNTSQSSSNNFSEKLPSFGACGMIAKDNDRTPPYYLVMLLMPLLLLLKMRLKPARVRKPVSF